MRNASGTIIGVRTCAALLALVLSDPAGARAQEARTPASPSARSDPRRPTLFLIGDSTVRNGRGDGANGQWGWGEPLASLFDASKIDIVNRALGGRSSRTFLTGGQWDAVRAALRPGDFLLMQFGHNDGGAVNDTSRARGSLRGTGGETEEIDNLLTHEHEVVHTYGWYLRRFIAESRAAGAAPIVLSPVPRKIWKDGRIVRSEDYERWAAEVARAEGVPFVDLSEIVSRRYEELGPEKVEALFADEHTHTTRAGAEVNAAAVVEGLQALEGRPLSAFLAPR
jgi:lysophospholipase L1-like esterase